MRRAAYLGGASLLFMLFAILGACFGGYCNHHIVGVLEYAVSHGGSFIVAGIITARRYDFVGTAMSAWGVFVTIVLVSTGITT